MATRLTSLETLILHASPGPQQLPIILLPAGQGAAQQQQHRGSGRDNPSCTQILVALGSQCWALPHHHLQLHTAMVPQSCQPQHGSSRTSGWRGFTVQDLGALPRSQPHWPCCTQTMMRGQIRWKGEIWAQGMARAAGNLGLP